MRPLGGKREPSRAGIVDQLQLPRLKGGGTGPTRTIAEGQARQARFSHLKTTGASVDDSRVRHAHRVLSVTDHAKVTSPHRVLVVDDSEDDYHLVKSLLRRAASDAYETTWCPDPGRALADMIAGLHDVYILDHHLVGTPGIELLEKAVAAGCAQPIVMLTGRDDATLDTMALHLGAADFVPKAELSPGLLERVLRYAMVHARTVQTMRHRALHDELTGLANRTLFLERLDRAVVQARRHREFAFALLYLDLDGFKPVNDDYGHAAGDTVLKAIAERLLEGRRETDTVARLGGDEFVILLPGLDRAEIATALAARMAERLADPIPAGDVTVRVGASIGIRLARGGQLDAAALLRDADAAMYSAKQRGGGRPVIAPMQDEEWSTVSAIPQAQSRASSPLCFVPAVASNGGWRAIGERSAVAIDHHTSRSRAREHLRHCLRQLTAWQCDPSAPRRLILKMTITVKQARHIAESLDEDLSWHTLGGAGLVVEVDDPAVHAILHAGLAGTPVEVVLDVSTTALAS